MIRISTASAEANALMGDRLEMKIGLNVFCETRENDDVELVKNIEESKPQRRRPGYVILWPEENEDAWQIGKRYAIPEAQVLACAEGGCIPEGKPLVLKI